VHDGTNVGLHLSMTESERHRQWEATEPTERSDAPDDLRGAVKRSVLIKRNVSTRPVA